MDDHREFEPEGDELHDWEYPDPDEDEDPAEMELVACPMCGCDVYEDAEYCPLCGEYIPPRLAYRWRGKPVLWILIGLLGVVATALMLALG